MATYNGVPTRAFTMPQAKYSKKSTYPMVAKGVTVHNTYNDAKAASEINYMQGNNNMVSYHAAIDEKEVIFGAPLNRSTWHAGDGSNGYGNRNHISFEICYSKSGGEKYRKAEANAVKVIAYCLHLNKWGMSKLKKHQDWSGKNCPHRILDEKRWSQFTSKVSVELARLNGSSTASSNASYFQRGDTGDNVRKEQEKFKQAGYAIDVDGSFGPAMERVVKQFQADNGIVVDGYHGPASQAKLNEILNAKKEVSALPKDDGKHAKATKSHLASQEWAIANGISDGTYPAKNVTREQVWTMLHRMYNKINK